jgi:hypothetical protein
MVGTYCEIKDGGGTVIATGFGQISTIVTGGAISGNSVTPAMVPAAKVTSAKSWNCSLMLETANGNCITGAAGANTLPWCAFDASSKTTVNGSF